MLEELTLLCMKSTTPWTPHKKVPVSFAAKVANHEYDFVEKTHKEDLALAKLILKSYLYTFLENVQFKSNLVKSFCVCGSCLHSNNPFSNSSDIQGQKMIYLLTSDRSIVK